MKQEAQHRDAPLLERENEIRTLHSLLERARGGQGGVVVVEAQAGVGKTSLLRDAADAGTAAGMRVLRGRGSALDRPFAFGVVRQVFERAVLDDPELLTEGAETAEAVFSPAGAAAARPNDSLFAALQGLSWLTANIAAREPLLLLVDDVHWTDGGSVRWLAFLAERIEEMPVLLVAATRPAEPGAEQEMIDALMTSASTVVLRPAHLSPKAATEIVQEELPKASEAFSDACHRATGGNPFLLEELLGELVADGLTGATEEAPQVLEFGSERVALSVRRRLRLLPADATALARAVAVLGPGVPLDEASGLASIDAPAARKAADALAGIDVLTADLALEFVHPVVGTAVYEAIPPLEREALHIRATELLSDRGAKRERIARHLMNVPPAGVPDRVEILRQAAAEASTRGSPQATIGYLRRALQEPPAAAELGPVLLELGVAEAADRQRSESVTHLREAVSATPDPAERGMIALGLVRALAATANFTESVEAAEEALGQIEDRDGPLGIALEAELLAIGFHDFTSTDRVAPFWERRLEQLDRGEDLPDQIMACLVMKLASSRPPAGKAIELAGRVSQAPLLEEPNSVVGGMLGNGLIYAGAIAEAGHFYDSAIATATQRGNRLTAAWQMIMRSDASLRLGEIRRAESEAVSSLELFDEEGAAAGPAWAAAHVLYAMHARGAFDEEDELLLGQGIGLDARPSLPLALLIAARAELHLARGRPVSALNDARAAGALLSPTITNPSCSDWRTVAALALAALGRTEEAVEMAEAELADARRFENPAAIGVSLRTRALTSVGAESVELLRDSVEVLEGSEDRLEGARSLLELGAALRRTGEVVEGREILREALDAASRIGASGLADRAHEELVVAGARPRRDRRLLSGRESLTASEDRVATLAAEGLTNREIAQRQFVTVKAVEWHLRNVYRKLDITSRGQLPEALS